jgi:hypothetical protein
MNQPRYAISGDTTEWDDILIKHGVTTRDEVLEKKGLNPRDYDKKPEAQVIEITQEEALDALDIDTLDDLDEEDGFSDTRMLDEYRKRRMDELKDKALRGRFGDVRDIVKVGATDTSFALCVACKHGSLRLTLHRLVLVLALSRVRFKLRSVAPAGSIGAGARRRGEREVALSAGVDASSST